MVLALNFFKVLFFKVLFCKVAFFYGAIFYGAILYGLRGGGMLLKRPVDMFSNEFGGVISAGS